MIREKKPFTPQRIQSELAKNPSWKIIVLKRSWLCPYCGEVGAHNLGAEDSLETRIAIHFAKTCPAFDRKARGRAARDPAPIDLETLEKRATLINLKYRVRKLLAREPVWRIDDVDGDWICPYCLRPVAGVELDWSGRDGDGSTDGPPPPPSATGTASTPEERAVNKVVRHLLECEDCRQGEGQERTLAELKERREGINRKKRGRKLRDHLERRPEWRFSVQPGPGSRTKEKSWLCPFCAQPAEVPFDKTARTVDDGTIEKVWNHLGVCAAYRVLEGKPRTERYLRDRVIAINKARTLQKLSRKLSRHATWQVTDADAVWYCPYCARPSGIRLPAPTRVTEAQVSEVWSHLASCPAYAGRRAQLKSPSYLRNVVAQADRTIRLRREVRSALVDDPRFGLADVYGSWLCPYCRKVQKPISMPADLSQTALIEKTIEQVVLHLLERCPGYVEGEVPEARLADLRRLVGVEEPAARAAPTPRAPRAAPGSEEMEFLQSVQRTIADLRSDLKSTSETKRELERSMEAARSVQRSLLPRVPEIPGFELAVIYSPSQSVGGDFYHFIPVSDHEWGIAIGDVAGHDVEAALLMGVAKKLLEIYGRGRSSPAETLALANQDIFPDLAAKSFVTAFYGVIDVESRRFQFARAGHNPIILFNARRRPALQVLDSKGMALGMDPGPVFTKTLEELEVPLGPGDLLIAYTDGVPESMNHDREEFGLERLHGTIEQHGTEEAEYVLYQIEKAIADFREGAKQKDDVTMVAVKVLE